MLEPKTEKCAVMRRHVVMFVVMFLVSAMVAICMTAAIALLNVLTF